MKTKLRNWSIGFVAVVMTVCCSNTSLAAAHVHPKGVKHKYVYYPEQNIYYVPSERAYYTWDREDRRWVSCSWGPAIYITSLTVFPRVPLYMETRHPYYYNEHHCREYRKPARVIVEEPIRPVLQVQSQSAAVEPERPRVQVNIQLSPVRVESRPVYIHHDHGHPGRGHGHHKHPKGHGHHHHH